MDLRNVIFAIALSFAVLFGWSVIFESPQVDQAKTGQAENRKQSQNSDTPNVNLEGVVSKNISRDEALKSVERINFENENVKGSISLMGALIDDITFKGLRWRGVS